MPGARGEATIQAGEREVCILFTNRALAEVETRLKQSIIAVAQGFADGTAGVTELVHLLRAGMQAARREAREGGAVSLNDAFEVLDEAGFTAVTVAVMDAVSAVLSFGTGDQDPNA